MEKAKKAKVQDHGVCLCCGGYFKSENDMVEHYEEHFNELGESRLDDDRPIDLKDGMRVRVDGRVYDVTSISVGVDEDGNEDLMDDKDWNPIKWDETKAIYHIGLYARKTKVALPAAPVGTQQAASAGR
jgi:hypothetical protein